MEIAVLIAVVTGISEVIKQYGLEKKFIPMCNLALGLVLGVLFLPADMKENILWGIVAGLSASGLFDQSKIIKK